MFNQKGSCEWNVSQVMIRMEDIERSFSVCVYSCTLMASFSQLLLVTLLSESSCSALCVEECCCV